jgi:DNA-binding NarL/FixJ family response regulator
MRVLVVADSGAVMAVVTRALSRLDDVEIVGYASGSARVDRLVRSIRPDVVLVDEMRRPGPALERLGEARDAGTVVVGLTAGFGSAWAVEALHAGALAAVPRDLRGEVLDRVLREAIDARNEQMEHGMDAVPDEHGKVAA